MVVRLAVVYGNIEDVRAFHGAAAFGAGKGALLMGALGLPRKVRHDVFDEPGENRPVHPDSDALATTLVGVFFGAQVEE